MKDFRSFISDEVLKVLLSGDLAVKGNFRFVRVLGDRKDTFKAD